MIHLLLVTDSDVLRRGLVALRPDLEWIPARSGDEAIEVIARSSRLDAVIVARAFPELEENDLLPLPAPRPAGDLVALRHDQGLAVAAAIRVEIPGNLPIAILGAEPREVADLVDVSGWPDPRLSAPEFDAAIAKLLGGS